MEGTRPHANQPGAVPCGRPTGAQVEEAVDAWHAARCVRPLYEALGWSADEYDTWLRDPDAIPDRPLPRTVSGDAAVPGPAAWTRP